MMAALSGKSNRNGGAVIGMGGAKKIASNLIRRLISVSVHLLLLGIRSWRTCVVLVCIPSH